MKKNFTILLVITYLLCISIFANSASVLMKQYNFALKSKNYLEGYSQDIGKNQFKYHSLRMDITEGLLTRCKNGDMEIEWLTGKIPQSNKEVKGYWFAFLADVQMTNERCKFDVYINDIKRFEFISGREKDRIFKNKNGGILEFTTIDYDQYNDAMGYMSLYTPASWVQKGESVKIKIIGESAGSNTWLIIFKAKDVIPYLQNLVKYETWLNVDVNYDGKNSYINFTAPNTSNKNITINIGSESYKKELKPNGDSALTQLVIKNKDIRNLSFGVKKDEGELISLSSLDKEIKKQKLLQKSLLINEINIENGISKIYAQRIYKPNAVENLLNLSKSNLSKGTLILMNSSHQDIAWMDSPEKCVIERDTMLLTPLFNKAMSSDTSYHFDIEDVLMLKEYITRHPDKKEDISNLLRSGKISCGSSYIQPYE